MFYQWEPLLVTLASPGHYPRLIFVSIGVLLLAKHLGSSHNCHGEVNGKTSQYVHQFHRNSQGI